LQKKIEFTLLPQKTMETNYLIVFSTALIPLAVGFVWYGPLFGKAWMIETGLTEEKPGPRKMMVVFGFCLFFSLMLAFFLPSLVIHQSGIISTMMGEPGIPSDPMSNPDYKMMMDKYGQNFRTFKHGLFHGVLSAIFFGLPLMGINALFEQKSWKYIFMHLGYWALTLGLMGGVICQWA
jgi:hypothetical protein